MKIVYVRLIVYEESEQFVDELKGAIEEFQKNGSEVEIQYGISSYFHSALVIARKSSQ